MKRLVAVALAMVLGATPFTIASASSSARRAMAARIPCTPVIRATSNLSLRPFSAIPLFPSLRGSSFGYHEWNHSPPCWPRNGLKMTVLVPEGSILNVKRITDAAFSLLVYYRSRFQSLFGSKLVVFKPKYES